MVIITLTKRAREGKQTALRLVKDNGLVFAIDALKDQADSKIRGVSYRVLKSIIKETFYSESSERDKYLTRLNYVNNFANTSSTKTWGRDFLPPSVATGLISRFS